ncbi:MAG: NAD(P)-dependent oxidoreductase [Steroidobacteraceae bacterium]|nr:NAD(P)-dependent oxidoreductase [Steroidobacteraceae bacterium]MCW5573197.1 NAD(P)-dependent oxidoreductase [Steroidobacteraceae bacterium]
MPKRGNSTHRSDVMKTGFIGLGRMGIGIAQRILGGGFDLAVWNRTAARAQPLLTLGASSTASIRELAMQSDLLFTCLTGDEAILEIIEGEEGILAGLRPGAVHVCLMTISPTCADTLERMHRAHGSHYVAGPVSGRPDAAAAGKLICYLAGPADAVQRAQPVCAAFSSQVIAVSERPRAANCLKLSINFTLCSIMEVLGEAYTFAGKCGVNTDLLNDWYQMAFAHPALKTYANKIRARAFDTDIGYSMAGGLKDVRLMLSTAREVGVRLETGELVEQKTREAIEAGLSEVDWTGFTEITRRRAGGGD